MITQATFALVLLAGGQLSAESVWDAAYTNTEGRSHAFTLTLKVSDGTVSGTVSSPRGSVPISAGTLKDREISFTVTRRANYDTIDVIFTGTIDGDLMRLSMRVGPRAPIAVTAKRQGAAPTAKSADVPRRSASASRRVCEVLIGEPCCAQVAFGRGGEHLPNGRARVGLAGEARCFLATYIPSGRRTAGHAREDHS